MEMQKITRKMQNLNRPMDVLETKFFKFFKMHLFSRLWKNSPQVENMPSISLDHAVQFSDITYLRWKVHQDWVSKVKHQR